MRGNSNSAFRPRSTRNSLDRILADYHSAACPTACALKARRRQKQKTRAFFGPLSRSRDWSRSGWAGSGGGSLFTRCARRWRNCGTDGGRSWSTNGASRAPSAVCPSRFAKSWWRRSAPARSRSPPKIQSSAATDAELQEWTRAAGGSHLVLGVAHARAGLLEEAGREFEALVRENPESPLARQLLEQVQSRRVR